MLAAPDRREYLLAARCRAMPEHRAPPEADDAARRRVGRAVRRGSRLITRLYGNRCRW